MQLISVNANGNIHDTIDYVNRCGLAGHLVHIEAVGQGCIFVVCVDDRVAPGVRAFFRVNPEHQPNKPLFDEIPFVLGIDGGAAQ